MSAFQLTGRAVGADRLSFALGLATTTPLLAFEDQIDSGGGILILVGGSIYQTWDSVLCCCGLAPLILTTLQGGTTTLLQMRK